MIGIQAKYVPQQEVLDLECQLALGSSCDV